MERILTDSEKIRRAEEIYARRRGVEIEESEEKNRNYSLYKVCFRGLLLINIIIAVLCVQNKEIIFKQEFLNEFLKYSQIINQKVNTFINDLKNNQNMQGSDELEKKNIEDSSGIEVKKEIVENTAQYTINEENVEKINEVKEELTIEEKIKSSYSFIKPVEGTVTSFFGDRESVYQNVKGNHKGIDVGAKSGTKIIAAMEGTVIQVSSQGDYGKHLKIQKDNIITLYAHCKKIYVKEGENVQQGKEIAEVGSTRQQYRTSFTF